MEDKDTKHRPVFSTDLKLVGKSRDARRFRSGVTISPVRGRLKSVRHDRARHRLSNPHNQDLQRGHQDVRAVRATCAEKLNGSNKIQAIDMNVPQTPALIRRCHRRKLPISMYVAIGGTAALSLTEPFSSSFYSLLVLCVVCISDVRTDEFNSGFVWSTSTLQPASGTRRLSNC